MRLYRSFVREMCILLMDKPADPLRFWTSTDNHFSSQVGAGCRNHRMQSLEDRQEKGLGLLKPTICSNRLRERTMSKKPKKGKEVPIEGDPKKVFQERKELLAEALVAFFS